MQDFTKLIIWRKAHTLVLDVYRATTSFPNRERYGLTRQMQRAATSVATNIAEGCGSNSRAEFARFLSIAAGSASELEYQILLSRDLSWIVPEVHARMSNKTREVKRMLWSLHQKLRTDD